jgi:hypothetical protein
MSLEQSIQQLNANLTELIRLIRQTNETAAQSWSSLVPPAPAEKTEAANLGAVATAQAPDATLSRPPPVTPSPSAPTTFTHEQVRDMARSYFAKDPANSGKLKAFLAEKGIVSVTACPAERLSEIATFVGGEA